MTGNDSYLSYARSFALEDECCETFVVHLNKLYDIGNNLWCCSTVDKTDAMILLKLMHEVGIKVNDKIQVKLQLNHFIWGIKLRENFIQKKIEKLRGFKGWVDKI